jgi:5-methylcytosine-specific restriction endonuclease McrA
MLNSSVLVLNRSYIPIHVTSVRRAVSLLYRDFAHAVNEEYRTFDFEEWRSVSAPRRTDAIGTSSGCLRIPRVIVLLRFDRIPRRHVRYSRVNVFARDRFTCQYCGVHPHRSQLNLDHVIPRSLGGKTTWENVVCCCLDCNRCKGGRTPEQARLRLRRSPARPRWSPLMNLAVGRPRYAEWHPFMAIVDRSYRAKSSGE